MGDFWMWVQRGGEAITLLGLGLHGYRQFRKGLSQLEGIIRTVDGIPAVRERLTVAEERISHHLSDGHGPPPLPVPAMRQPSPSQAGGA